MLQKKNEGILFSAEIRVVGSYTDRLLSFFRLRFFISSSNFLVKSSIFTDGCLYTSNNYVGFAITEIDLDPAGLDQLYI